MIPLHAILTLLLIASPSINSAHSNLYQDPAYASIYPDSTVYSMGSIVQNYTMTQASFEVELGWTHDIPSLHNESDIAVLGKVQDTPRYGSSGEVWVDEVWMNYDFDSTLSDRFIVNCTEEKAINMSNYTWVEWTAPMLEGTTYEETQPSEQPPEQPPEQELGIIFEYGAESGVLQPPWQEAGPSPANENPMYGYAKTTTQIARTGTRSIELYQPPPTKTAADRRILLSISQTSFSTKSRTAYLSWWVYFPSGYSWNDENGWGDNLGGLQSWFGPPTNRHAFRTRVTFIISHSGRKLQLTYAWWKYPDRNGDGQLNSDDSINWTWDWDDIRNHLDEWIHLQLYWKITSGSDSVVRGWVNNVLVGEKTTWTEGGITCAAPEAYSSWNNFNIDWWEPSHADGYPTCSVLLYSEVYSPEKKLYIDDIVWSTDKVPEDYRVIGR